MIASSSGDQFAGGRPRRLVAWVIGDSPLASAVVANADNFAAFFHAMQQYGHAAPIFLHVIPDSPKWRWAVPLQALNNLGSDQAGGRNGARLALAGGGCPQCAFLAAVGE
jgi:hypothetical protein